MLGPDAVDPTVVEEEVHHAAEQHVNEGVDPQGCEEDEQSLHGGPANVLLGRDGDGAEDVAAAFPESAHDQDPAEGFPVHDGLDGVRDAGEAEEAGEGDGGAEGGAVGIESIGVRCVVADEFGHFGE